MNRFILGDEIWVHHSTPETKPQNMAWKTVNESMMKKAKVAHFAGKAMTMGFWNTEGVLLIDIYLVGLQ